jgi:hypothetical protein
LGELHIPLIQGLSEGIDPKILPEGGLTTLSNARFLKDARVGVRQGYQTVGHVPSPPLALAAANFGPRFSVYVGGPVGFPATTGWFAREDNQTLTTQPLFTQAQQASCLSTISDVRRYVTARNTSGQVMACDVAYANKYLVEAWQDADYGSGTLFGVGLSVRSAISHDVVHREQTDATGHAPKCVAIGDKLLTFYVTSDFLWTAIVDTNNPTGDAVIVNILTPASGKGYLYDVAPYDDTKCLLVYQKSATVVEWGTVDGTGFYTAVDSFTIAADAYLTITANYGFSSSRPIAIGYTEAGAVKYRTYLITGGTLASATIGSGGGFPVIGPSPNFDWVMAWSVGDVTGATPTGTYVWAPGYLAPRLVGFLNPVSKPFVGPEGVVDMWCVNSVTISSPATGTYKLIAVESVAQPNTPFAVKGAVCEAVACQLTALPGFFDSPRPFSIVSYDPRRFCILAPMSVDQTTTSDFLLVSYVALLPVLSRLGGLPTTGQFGADLVRFDSGPLIDACLPAHINGQLFLSGGRLKEFDGSNLYESGLADGIEHFVVIGQTEIQNPGGVLPPNSGTYLYTALYSWIDDLGRRHRSAPAAPYSILFGPFVPWTSTDIYYSIPAFSDRIAVDGLTCSIQVEIYRTQANGSIFYLVTETPVPVGLLDGKVRIFHDHSTTDADLATHEVLYTQGRNGGLSGLLPNDEPPPCRMIWGGNDRLFMGGLEQASAVQWSKLLFPGEPMAFAHNEAYRAYIDDDVSAIASLDGQWFIASTRGWWVVTGEGPDDTGAGSFSSPQRIPADVGCLSQRSIVEIPEGLLFQATADRIYLMPRGGGAPVWIAQAVRTTLAQFPVITAARLLPDSNLVYFICVGADSHKFALLIYDTRAKQWMTDILTQDNRLWCLDRFDDHVVLSGIYEPAGYEDRFTGPVIPVSMQCTTGDIRPFGLQGRGRVRKVVVLGESASVFSSTLQIEVSYDSGQTWLESSTNTITPTAAGEPFYVEHMVVKVKGTNYRLRLTIAPVLPDSPLYRLGFPPPLGDTQNVWLDLTTNLIYPPPGTSGLPLNSGIGDPAPPDTGSGAYYLNTTTGQVFQKTPDGFVFVWTPVGVLYSGHPALIINAISLEHYPQSGTPRLANANRG